MADDRVPMSGIEVRGRAEIVPTDPDLAPVRRIAARYIAQAQFAIQPYP